MLQTSGAMQTRPVEQPPRCTNREPDLDTGAYEVAPIDIDAELERLGEQLLDAADRLGLDV